MQEFLQSLTPEQWAVVVGLFSPYIQYFIGKFSKFQAQNRDVFNWLLAFVLPFIGTLAVFLSNSPSFNHLVPIYATIFTTGQIIYFSGLRYYKKYKELTTPVPEVAQTF